MQVERNQGKRNITIKTNEDQCYAKMAKSSINPFKKFLIWKGTFLRVKLPYHTSE